MNYIYNKGNDFVPSSFHRWLRDRTGNITFFGLEYKPESKIIATRIIKVIDGGITGFTIGHRVHPHHQGKRLFFPFMEWSDKMIKRIYPKLQRIRSTTYGKNTRSIHLQKKSQLFQSKDTMRTLYGDISFPSNKTNNTNFKAMLITPSQFEQRLSKLNLIGKKLFDKEIEIITDIDQVIELLKYRYGKRELYVDWKVYDLAINKESIIDTKYILNKEIIARRMTIYCNKSKSVMCLLYVDGRKRLRQIHIYAENKQSNENDILLMIRSMYKNWINEMTPIIAIDSHNGLKFWIYLDEVLANSNPKLQSLCQQFDTIVLTEKKLS